LSAQYELFGGAPAFEKLVREFYLRVAQDPILRPMYPEEDLGPAERRLRMFLEQYWGGPDTYQQERGHPRLRMRHNQFHIGPKARDAWLRHMHDAMRTLGLADADEAILWDYLERAAHAMLNTFED
jgi:hemoglobin